MPYECNLYFGSKLEAFFSKHVLCVYVYLWIYKCNIYIMVLKNALRRAPQGAPHGVFIIYAPQRGVRRGILIVVFDVFDFLCQFQAFYVFFMCVFDDFSESDDEIS
ncbi:hypothetical protein Hanom_Chr01g00038641 [Helianthus anomalus]